MTGLGTVRHGVRRIAARTRRTVMWSPVRFRAAILAATAVLVLVPLVSLVARAPWTRATPGAAAAETRLDGGGAAGGQGGGSVENGLGAGGVLVTGGSGATADGPRPTGTGASPTAGGATGAAAAPVDPSPIGVAAVLRAGGASPTTGASRTRGATGPTLSPGAATDRWTAQARTSAVRFSQAWLAGSRASDADAWLRTLSPWLDPAAEPLVALTNLAAIPATTAATVQLVTLTDAESTAVVVLADGGRLDLELVWDGESWRVTSYEPVAGDGVRATP